jgi:putative exosortase-associated protein (TIGR04073 family)
MLKRFVLSISMATILVLAGDLVRAEDPSLPEQIGTKFVRGVANLAAGWVEIPKQIYEVGSNEGWVVGALRGPFDGLGMFAARTIAGAYEILTFPIPVPPRYQPLVEPEFVWEAELPPRAPRPEPSSP